MRHVEGVSICSTLRKSFKKKKAGTINISLFKNLKSYILSHTQDSLCAKDLNSNKEKRLKRLIQKIFRKEKR